MTTAIVFASLYLMLMPIVFWAIGFAQKKLVVERAMVKAQKTRNTKNLPEPIWNKWKEHISFTMKDTSTVGLQNKDGSPKINMSNKKMFWVLYLGGFALTVVTSFINIWLAVLMLFTFFASIIFGTQASKKLIAERKRMMTRMFEIAKLKLGQSAEYQDNPGQVIRILEWSDPITPTKVEFDVPTSFGADGEEGFLKQYNQIFGTETSWVAHIDPDEKVYGWDYDKGTVTIRAVPPLPTMAKWSAHYVVNENIAWSFFPIALGVENGMPLTNPETGEEENVLGFDLSGLQVDLAKEKKVKIGGEITTSPMCLTGDTLILTDEGVMEISQIATLGRGIKVKSLDEDGQIVSSLMLGTKMMEANAKIVKLTLSDGATVRCTPDHEFRMASGIYMQARDMIPGISLITGYNQDNVCVEKIEDAGFADVFDGEVKNTHNFIIANRQHLYNTTENSENPREIGIISSNCFVGGGTGGGKSIEINTLVQVLSPHL